MERVVVVGTSCAGKTTLAGELARLLEAPHVELDALYWKPDWEARHRDEFRALVERTAAGDRWVIDGNYGTVRDILWPRATAAVWLNYSFARVMARALARTSRRIVAGEELYSGNRESFRRAFFDRDSILWWVITTYARRRREYARLFRSAEHANLRVRELRRPSDARRFLAELATARDEQGFLRLSSR